MVVWIPWEEEHKYCIAMLTMPSYRNSVRWIHHFQDEQVSFITSWYPVRLLQQRMTTSIWYLYQMMGKRLRWRDKVCKVQWVHKHLSPKRINMNLTRMLSTCNLAGNSPQFFVQICYFQFPTSSSRGFNRYLHVYIMME